MQKYKHWVNSVVPYLKQFACFHFEFALADDRVNLRFDWSLGLLWFGFTTFNGKLLLIKYLKSSLYGSLFAVLVLKANSNNVSSLEGIISK